MKTLKTLVFGAAVAALSLSAGTVTRAQGSDIVDTAVAAGQFKTLAAALQAAGLVDTLKGRGPVHRVRADRRGVRQAAEGHRRGSAEAGEQGQADGDPHLSRRRRQGHGRRRRQAEGRPRPSRAARSRSRRWAAQVMVDNAQRGRRPTSRRERRHPRDRQRHDAEVGAGREDIHPPPFHHSRRRTGAGPVSARSRGFLCTRIPTCRSPPLPPPSNSAARARRWTWVREIMQWHFSPETGCPFWLEWAAQARLGSATRSSAPTTTSTGSAPSRTSGCAAVRCGAGCRRAYAGPPDLRLRNRRQHRRAEVAHQRRRFPHRLRSVQRHPARRMLSEGRRLARWSGRPARAGCASRSSTWRSIAAASASWSISTRAG